MTTKRPPRKNQGAKPGEQGQAAHIPTPATRAKVEAYAACGTTHPEICNLIGISDNTLQKYYRTELDIARPKAVANVAMSLYRKATGEGPQSVAAAIFWLKTRAGWKETQIIAGDSDLPPVKMDHSI